MRKLGLTLLFAAMASFPYAAHSQESAQGSAPTADDYVCALTDECEEQATDADANAETGGRPRVSATRSFSLSRPTAPTPTTPTTRTAPQTPQRQTASRPNRRQVASRPQTPAAQRRVDLQLAFGSGSSALSGEAQAQLRTFAEALRRPQLASARVRIEGHTDSSGSRATNLNLSQRRAQAVADYLQSQGVAGNRLEVRGYGYDRPLPGRRASAPENRRVEAARIS